VGWKKDRRRRILWVRRKIGEEECCGLGERYEKKNAMG
jgi:hypothetical protein